jgi:hypothetical protein
MYRVSPNRESCRRPLPYVPVRAKASFTRPASLSLRKRQSRTTSVSGCSSIVDDPPSIRLKTVCSFYRNESTSVGEKKQSKVAFSRQIPSPSFFSLSGLPNVEVGRAGPLLMLHRKRSRSAAPQTSMGLRSGRRGG